MIKRNMFKKNILSILALLLPLLTAPATMAAAENTQFSLDVGEVLMVSVTTPSSGATGTVNNFLRNTVGLEVTTNNGNGFTALMATKTDTPSLVNTFSADTIPTLSNSATRSDFPADHWGYSISDTTDLTTWSSDTPDSDSGVAGSTYKPIVGSESTPITVLRAEGTASRSQDIYFGAKASSSSDSGTYTNTVVISVVSGISTENNIPENPVTPIDDAIANNNTGTYVPAPTGGNSGATVYHYTSSTSTTETDTTIVTDGDTHNYVEYTAPQGVSRIIEGTPLAAGLAIVAAVAATSGAFFLILAKRKKDKEDEEDDYYDY